MNSGPQESKTIAGCFSPELLFSKRFLVPIAFQQTNRPVPVVYSLNTEFQLCNNEKVFMMDPATADVSMADMDYKGAFSMGETAETLQSNVMLSNLNLVTLLLLLFKLIYCVCSPCRPDSVWQGFVEP